MPRKRGASQFIGLNRHRVTASDLKVRLAERDRRLSFPKISSVQIRAMK
ncbi:MAG: hypothetical protein WA693_16015 [Pseudolabrys sp.]|jgi:hypothetical protein